MTDFAPDLCIDGPTETVSQKMPKDAFAPVRVTDDAGRVIEAARLKPSERFAIKRMMGAEAGNANLLDDMLLVAHCVSLDGERISRPTSLLQAMALMDRLKDEGLNALDQAIGILYGVGEDKSVANVAKT